MRPYLALAVLAIVLLSSSHGKAKRHETGKPKNMSISMFQVEGCDAWFYVEQEPNPFLTNVVEFKENGAVKFRTDTEIVENYPDEIALRIEYRADRSILKISTMPLKVCEPFEPSRIKFKAFWSNASRTVPADGVVLKQEDVGPDAFCELTCSDLWVYQLKLESKGVPLMDDLVIAIDSSEGKHISKLVGGLVTLGPAANTITPVHR